MDPVPEYSLFLGRILDELGSQSSNRTHKDLCSSLCARFDLVHLAKLRSLLFSTACLEPSFPAALFQDRMRCSPLEPQARKLTVAADIVSIFNLIQVDRDAKDTPPAASLESLPRREAFRYQDNQSRPDLQPHPEVPGLSTALQPDRASCQFLRSSDPNSLLRLAGKDLVPPPSGPPSPQSAHFSMNMDGGSSTEPESLQTPDGFSPPGTQRRSDFHHPKTFCPQVERDHHYDFSHSQRPPKLSKKPHQDEQVFPSHPLSSATKTHAKANAVYTDLRLAGLEEGRRSQLSWTLEENRRNLGEKGNPLTKMDLQVQESLNPGDLEFWMEDVYTPGFDSLLKKKEAEFRRAKAWKIGALITAAACTVILVIIVPICTMRS